jgi:hypothetical protein
MLMVTVTLRQASKGQAAGTAAGDIQYWNGTAWVVVAATTNEGAALQMIGGVPTCWRNCNRRRYQ